MPDSDGSRTMTQRGKAGRQPWVATATFTSAFHLHSRLPQLPVGTYLLSFTKFWPSRRYLVMLLLHFPASSRASPFRTYLT